MIIDSHTHLDDHAFDADRREVIEAFAPRGIGRAVDMGASFASAKRALELAETYPQIYCGIGIHPTEIKDLNEDCVDWLKEKAAHEKVVCIGEIGLDYYWEKDEEQKDLQKEGFRKQIQLAKEVKLPINIHSRDAAEDTMKILKETDAVENGAIVHCYSYSPEYARRYCEMGYYFGIGGVVTYTNARKLKEVVKEVPLDRILLETDAPYLSPVPNRGKRNDSRNLRYVIQAIAELKGISSEEVEKVTEENARRVYFKLR